MGDLWSTRRKDGTELIGEKGSGLHTHICPDKIIIADESKPEHTHDRQLIVWNIPALEPPCPRCHKPHAGGSPCY